MKKHSDITTLLFNLQDKKYKDFSAKLNPTLEKESIIGVRIPQIRNLAKQLYKQEDTKLFLKVLPHKYFEENNLHSFIIELIPDYDLCTAELESFLPFIDNWATCDSLNPKCFKKHTDDLILKIDNWLKSKHTYTVRFGIKMLMTYYLDDFFRIEYLKKVASIKSDEYYVNMMIAWYFATALAKQYDNTITFMENKILPIWVHNKTIQKATESYRITKEQKAYLKKLKI